MARILLVEDDHDNVRLLVRLLEHHHHEVIVATDTATAESLAQGEPCPDLILMDLELPAEPEGEPDPNSGLEATRALKASNATSSIPVIALTAHTMAQHQERIAEAGCDDFQEKPIFPFESLLEKIERWAGPKE